MRASYVVGIAAVMMWIGGYGGYQMGKKTPGEAPPPCPPPTADCPVCLLKCPTPEPCPYSPPTNRDAESGEGVQPFVPAPQPLGPEFTHQLRSGGFLLGFTEQKLIGGEIAVEVMNGGTRALATCSVQLVYFDRGEIFAVMTSFINQLAPQQRRIVTFANSPDVTPLAESGRGTYRYELGVCL